MNLNSFIGIIPDNTQLAFINYLRETEKIMRQLIKEYDFNGDVQIIPAPDLGFPNNLRRINGGFATGIVINWKCNRPIVFIDTTINSCVSSCYELSVNTDYQKFFNTRSIKESIQKQFETPYRFNIDSGNHFIALCKSVLHDKLYLVQHFSDTCAKHPKYGLYPNKEIWYKERIKEYCFGNRVLRYILDEDAVEFFHKAKQAQKLTIEGHRFLASQLIGGCNYSGEIIAPHYGMFDQNTIYIGCFISLDSQILPVFSDIGKPITLVQTSNNRFVFRTFDNIRFNIIPHGWGQKWNDDGELLITSRDNYLVVKDKSGSILQWDVTQKTSSINSKIIVRDLSIYHQQDHDELSTYHTIDTLFQIAAYTGSEEGVHYYE